MNPDLSYYSDPGILQEVCRELVLEKQTDIETFEEIIGCGDNEWECVSEVLFSFLSHKVDWMYPYLKSGETFVNYIESLKNAENDGE